MSKAYTEIDLNPGGDIAVKLDLEHADPNNPSAHLQIAKVGDMTVTLDPAAIQRKQDALEQAAFIEVVTDEPTRQLAIESVGTLKAYTNGIEKSRKEVKQPFWDAGQAIDEIAKKEAGPVLLEIKRVEALLAAYQRKIEAAAAAALREQEAERQRLIAAEQARLAEEQRLRDEAERLSREAQEAAQGKGKKAQAAADLARTQAELAKTQADLMASQRRQDEQAAQFTPVVHTPVAPEKAAGTMVRRDWDIEVTDWDALHKAYGWRFIKKELDLQSIKFHLGTPGVDPDKIPGVKATPKTNVHVRAAKA